jgi:Fic family protein
MDDGTAFELLGQTVALMIDGLRVEGVMVAGHKVSSSGPGTVDLLLPTRIGEPENRVRITLDKVELAPDLTEVQGPPVGKIEDSTYEPFRSFSEWELATISSAWAEFLASLDLVRQSAAPADLQRALEVALRSAALETGAIEGLYSTSRGVTRIVALQGALWEVELDKLGPEVRGHFEAQLAALELVLDAATSRRPLTEAWLRSLHAQVCANQKTYKVLTQVGWQERPLEHGAYKTDPNNVTLAGGGTHWYCPVDQVGPEMHRLLEEIRSPGFESAHPVVQAAFAHHALTAVHPFADGNGRVARALASVFLYRAAGIPLIVFSDQQERYWDALAAADSGDPQPFVTFMDDRAADAMALVTGRLREARSPLESRAAALRKLFRAHGGLSTTEVVAVAERLTSRLHEDLPQLARSSLSESDFGISVGVKQGPQQCTYWDLPYHTLPRGGAFALRVESKDPLVIANGEATPFVGIANDTRNPHAFIVIDANRPGPVPLKLRVWDLHPSMSKSALELIEGWERQTIGNLLDDLATAARGSLQGQGYAFPQDSLKVRVLRAIDTLIKERSADDRRADTNMVMQRLGLGADSRDEVNVCMSELLENGDVKGPQPLTGDGKVLDVTVTAITKQGSQLL